MGEPGTFPAGTRLDVAVCAAGVFSLVLSLGLSVWARIGQAHPSRAIAVTIDVIRFIGFTLVSQVGGWNRCEGLRPLQVWIDSTFRVVLGSIELSVGNPRATVAALERSHHR